MGQRSSRESREKIESFQEVGGTAGKVLVSPRTEALGKANVFLRTPCFLLQTLATWFWLWLGLGLGLGFRVVV